MSSKSAPSWSILKVRLAGCQSRRTNGHSTESRRKRVKGVDMMLRVPRLPTHPAQRSSRMRSMIARRSNSRHGHRHDAGHRRRWGVAKIRFGADDKPAREVLEALIQLEQQTNAGGAIHPEYNHWEVSCDGTGSPWCFIDVAGRFSGRCK
jgi:hypothetical protein